jgi:hypothetical protein
MCASYLKQLVETIMNAIEEHIDESPMRRNYVMIICRMNLPQDVNFVIERLINVLLKIIVDFIEYNAIMSCRHNDERRIRSDNFILRSTMHLLNSLAFRMHKSHKILVGALAMPVILKLIEIKIQNNIHDDIVQVAWTFLGNITSKNQE